eukprot:TRINITY_DN14420_c0_g1_i2.p1 TRINITY_DN14420_c0_g1~~TRINITY_DN14420_c0_g1_i2.p1  ORF type:complete len:489 (-),score=107.93 TRINITY_DN14420_c0_g1_i2:58-1524(-)
MCIRDRYQRRVRGRVVDPMRPLLRLVCLCASAISAEITITRDTPWVLGHTEIELGGLAPSLELALRDLRTDWYSTFGLEPVTLGAYFPYTDYISQGRHVGALKPPPAVPACNATGTYVFLGNLQQLQDVMPVSALQPVLEQLHGAPPESHACWVVEPSVSMVSTCTSGGWHAFTALVCTGVDALGTVFSAYELSHAVLGVNPQGIWVEPPKLPVATSKPVHTKPVGAGIQQVLPADGGLVSLSPGFRYRGFFVNDEDMLGEMARDPLGESVFSVSMWDRVYQLILRLKGNAVIVGTAGFPDERSMELAVRRGLYLAQHHVTPLGTNTFQWPTGVPYSFAHSRETQEFVWDLAIEQQSGMSQGNGSHQHLWTVGYRGLNDYPFWYDEPEFVTDEARGKLISEAMEAQVSAVRRGNGSQVFFTYLWSEMTELFVNGHLEIPNGVTVVHADSGNGYVDLSLIHISEPTRLLSISYAVFCLKKKKKQQHIHE